MASEEVIVRLTVAEANRFVDKSTDLSKWAGISDLLIERVQTAIIEHETWAVCRWCDGSGNARPGLAADPFEVCRTYKGTGKANPEPPCPGCDGEARVWEEPRWSEHGKGGSWVSCSECCQESGAGEVTVTLTVAEADEIVSAAEAGIRHGPRGKWSESVEACPACSGLMKLTDKIKEAEANG